MVAGCKLKHPAAGELLDGFVEALCKQLKPGCDHVMKTAGGKKRAGAAEEQGRDAPTMEVPINAQWRRGTNPK